MDDDAFEQIITRLRALDGDSDPARVLARIATHLGAWSEWDSSMIEEVAREIGAALHAAGLPSCSDDDREAHVYWGEQARALGWDSDAPGPYLATINTPGYLPWSEDPPTFETVREAWQWLADERREQEEEESDVAGYSATVNQLEARAEGNFDPAFGPVDEVTGLGTIYGPTPGYDGEHDLGKAYNVTRTIA
jgi:hypothetical protein